MHEAKSMDLRHDAQHFLKIVFLNYFREQVEGERFCSPLPKEKKFKKLFGDWRRDG